MPSTSSPWTQTHDFLSSLCESFLQYLDERVDDPERTAKDQTASKGVSELAHIRIL